MAKLLRTRANLKSPNIQARYDAAGSGRRVRGWTPPSSGPNRAVQGLQTLRNRSDDARRNDWSAKSGIQKWTTNLVGIGIGARFDRITSKARRTVIADLFWKFRQQSDADGVLSLDGQQTLGVSTWLAKGEVFIRERPRDLTLPLEIPVQFQMLEPEFCPLFDADSWPGLPVGNRIRQGIELNRYDRRIAYWMHKEHPGEGTLGHMPTESNLVRVAASEVWHMFEPDRPGALRGVSILAPVLIRLRSTGDFEDAVLDRQKLANLFVSFITRTLPEAQWSQLDINPETGLPVFYDSDGTEMVGLEPGMQQELRPGEDVKFANPPEAGTMFSEYLRSTLLGTSAGIGLPYELLSGDIQNVSDRTLRVVLNEFRRLCEQRQWQIIIPMFCQRAVDAFAKYAALAGKITLNEVELVKRCTHAPQGWAYIHPVQDVQGKQLEIAAGLVSRDDVIAAKGDDPEETDDKRARARKREESLGLLDPTPAQKATQQQRQASQQNAQAATREQFDASTAVLQGIVAAVSRPAPPQAAPTFNLSLPASVVNVAPPNVTVEPAVVNVAPPNVTVEPAAVTVNVEPGAAPVVNVEPAAVVVHVEPQPAPIVNVEVQPADVTVSLPTRETTSKIVRDEQGNILRVTQTEKTVD